MMLQCWKLLGSGISTAGRWLFRDGGWKPALLGLLALLGAYLVWSYRDMRADRDAAQRASQEATAAAELIRTNDHAASRAVIGASEAKARISSKEAQGIARTEAALSANPDWASQPVPADVLSSLRD